MQSRYSWQSPYDRTLAPVGSGEDQLYSAFKECLATIKSNSQEDPTASDVHQICGEDDNKEPVWMVLVCKGPHTKEFFEAFEAVFNRWDVLRQAEEQKES